MFVLKNMDVNSNLLRLKLDMVYRDLPMDEAEKRFAEITATVHVEPKEEGPIAVKAVGKPKPKRKVIKALVAK